ncbi:LysR family transcriptional regulator [Agarivorans sp.]|uniref:LysR family transcriptional regulator n=1 Tax=Agarivorans sp. TaxID=1872412 RepID=UPI003CFD4A91
MDRFDAMRVYTRVFEQRSFSAAATSLNLPRSTVTEAVKQLEQRVGVRLLERTTRQVSPTLDGEDFYLRSVNLLAQLEEAENAFTGAKPKGKLRVEVHGTLARHFLLPKLAEFLHAYPDIELFLSDSDRLVDPLREGIDCVLRVGKALPDDMVAKQVSSLSEVTVAAPSYLQRHGCPRYMQDLKGHQMVGFRVSQSAEPLPLEFTVEQQLQHLRLPCSIQVNSAETLVEAARLGLGIIQLPRYHVEDDLNAASLQCILSEFPPEPSPVYLLYPRKRTLSARVRVFIDYLQQAFKA